MRSAHTVAVELCRLLEEERIEYALLGDACAPSMPAGHRIHLVVAQAVMTDLPATMHKISQRLDARLVSCTREQRQGWRCVLSWIDRDERPEFITLEVFSNFARSGRTLLKSRELLNDRLVEWAELRLRSAFFVATPAMEFIYYMLCCVHEQSLSDEQGQHLHERWRRDPEGVAAQVARFWDPAREGGIVLRAAENRDWQPVRDAMLELRQGLCRHRRVAFSDWVHEQKRRFQEWSRPSGLLLACLGPEGAGKASVIDALKDRPLTPFQRVHTMELRPRIVRPSSSEPGADEPKKKPRGRLATMAKLLMFAVDYWIGYGWQIRPRLVRAIMVVSNRYYDDVMVDPLRYRMTQPLAFARALLPWIPRPDLWLILDAPSEVISTRNRAITAQESSRLRREYRRLLRGYENVVMLDARQPIDKVLAHAERAIVRHLAERTAQRLGLPLETPRNPLSTRILLFFCRRNVPLLSRLVRIVYNSDIYCRLPAHLYLPHPYGIVIHPQAVIGDRVTVMQQVAIGDKDQGESVAPVIGNDVYIGAGARVLGDVRVGDGVTIGANAVVTHDIPAGVTVVGANRIVHAPADATIAASSRSIAPFPVNIQRGA